MTGLIRPLTALCMLGLAPAWAELTLWRQDTGLDVLVQCQELRPWRVQGVGVAV